MKRHPFCFLLIMVVSLSAVLAPCPSHAQDDTLPSAFGVEWSPDGKWIAVPSTDGLWIYNAEIVERAPVQYFTGSIIPAVAFDPSRDRMAVYDETARLIHIIEPDTGEVIINIPGAVDDYDFAYDLEYSLDGDFLAVGYDSSLKIYDAIANQELRSYDSNPVFSVAAGIESGTFVAGTFLGNLSTFNLNKAESDRSSFSPDDLTDEPVIYQVGLLPDGQEGLAIRWTGLIRFDVKGQTSSVFDPDLVENVHSFAFNHAGDTVAIGMDGIIVFHDLTTDTIADRFTGDDDSSIISLAFSPNDDKLVVLSASGTIQIFWELPKEAITVTWYGGFAHAYRPSWG